jgi:hypothetical protein
MVLRHDSAKKASAITLGVLAAAVLLSRPARADLPSPRFDRLTPLGAAAGSTVEVEIAAAEIGDVKTLLFGRPGFKIENLKERRFRVTIAANVPVGTYSAKTFHGYFGRFA